MHRLSSDVGGTFTDGVLLDGNTGEVRLSKALSTPENPAVGTIRGIEKLNVGLEDVSFLVHGTTVVVNALIESKGAKTALITTHGFRDVLEIGRNNRLEMYDPLYKKPHPLVPRHLRYGVKERILASGEILTPLDEEDLNRIIGELKRLEVEAVAVCLLNAYVNPVHEEHIGRMLQEQYPEAACSLSHRITRRYYEYERTSTTVQNAYVMPVVQSYLESLEGQLADRCFGHALQIMQSNGGIMTSTVARDMPIAMVESGPAAGAIGASKLAELIGYKSVIAYDMGGTTAKATMITGGLPETTDTYLLEERPILLPVVDLREIGAGGGSIAWIDEAGALHVGPKSSGASPGPACYMQGGTEPTVTDANLFIGLLNPDYFLGGEMRVDRGLAEQALGSIARGCGLALGDAALGIITIVNANMAGLLRSVTVARGYDPREFALVAYGGAGPLHAAAIAHDLNIPTIIVPVNSGAFSAWGMLMADLRHDVALTYVSPLSDTDIGRIDQILKEHELRVRELLKQESVADQDVVVEYQMDIRYLGQEHTLSVPVPRHFTDSDKADAGRAFDARHLAVYGHNAPEEPKELVSIRAIGIGTVRKPRLKNIASGEPRPPSEACTGVRQVYRGGGLYEGFDTFRRERLLAGNMISGPAVIEEAMATTVVESNQTCSVDPYGNLIISYKQGRLS